MAIHIIVCITATGERAARERNIWDRDLRSQNWMCPHPKNLYPEALREIPGSQETERQDAPGTDVDSDAQLWVSADAWSCSCHCWCSFLLGVACPIHISPWAPSAAWRKQVRGKPPPQSRGTTNVPMPHHLPGPQTGILYNDSKAPETKATYLWQPQESPQIQKVTGKGRKAGGNTDEGASAALP